MSGVAGIVLAGGRSSRMGRPKASLEWHGSTFAARVSGLLARSLDGPIVVVRAPGQELPALSPSVELVQDAREDRGPLEGIAAGLRAVRDRAAVAFISAVDVPLLQPAFVRRVVSLLRDEVDAAVPNVADRLHPLAGAYRVGVLPVVEELLARDSRRLLDLLEQIPTRHVDEDDLLADREVRACDPSLDSLRNVNDAAGYEAVLGLPLPPVWVRHRTPDGSEADLGIVHAATLGEAALVAALPASARPRLTLNGAVACFEPELPLVAGDAVAFEAT